jgi:hypothetical protein
MESTWVLTPTIRPVREMTASLHKLPPILPGTPDPYTPGNNAPLAVPPTSRVAINA